MTTPRHIATAERMGRAAGELLREFGIPGRCPAPLRTLESLRAAWARGYRDGAKSRR